MFWTKSFIPTLRETPQEAESVSHKLMLRAGLVRMLMAGVYSYLPLGLRVLDNIERIVRQEMDAAGAAEVLLPALQPQELWQKSGRDKVISDIMFAFKDRRGRSLCLGPTHEEVITELVKNHISSYRQLPIILYQIQTKFRDEMRPRFGLVRSCEFIMKDAYSFDKDQEGLDKSYKAMQAAYNRIFGRCGIKALVSEADSGVMGGDVSHEFMVATESGEDIVLSCPKCGYSRPAVNQEQSCPVCKVVLEETHCVEVGHIFKLGTKYTSALDVNFLDAHSRQQPVIMGCYGIGVSRLVSAIIEQNHDKDGIIFPAQVSPYKVIVLPLDVQDTAIMEAALSVYRQLGDQGVEVLCDDRDERPGVKFKDADLLGIPLQVIVGKGSLKEGKIELKTRRTQQKIVASSQEIVSQIKGF